MNMKYLFMKQQFADFKLYRVYNLKIKVKLSAESANGTVL